MNSNEYYQAAREVETVFQYEENVDPRTVIAFFNLLAVLERNAEYREKRDETNLDE